MQLSLPQYQLSYSSRISELAYTQVRDFSQNLLDRTMLIYEKYCNTGDDKLYALFWNTLEDLRPSIKILQVVAWSELNKLSLKLRAAAEASSLDELVYRPTMLWDLSGCLSK